MSWSKTKVKKIWKVLLPWDKAAHPHTANDIKTLPRSVWEDLTFYWGLYISHSPQKLVRCKLIHCIKAFNIQTLSTLIQRNSYWIWQFVDKSFLRLLEKKLKEICSVYLLTLSLKHSLTTFYTHFPEPNMKRLFILMITFYTSVLSQF